MLPLILASSSRYRQALLSRLGLPFSAANPAIDETARPGETPTLLVARLAEAKARAIPTTTTGELIIASDQVASLEGRILTKPGNHRNACQQLQLCSAKTVTFYTALALLNTRTNNLQQTIELYTVRFRPLNETTIERYLSREQPYDCAGSFKMEGLGISLFESLQGNDPNSLIGLPLIQLVSLLKNEGIAVP
jgi:MAF protein